MYCFFGIYSNRFFAWKQTNFIMKKTLVIIALVSFFGLSTVVHASKGAKETSTDPKHMEHVEAPDQNQTDDGSSMIEDFVDDVVEWFRSWEFPSSQTISIHRQ